MLIIFFQFGKTSVDIARAKGYEEILAVLTSGQVNYFGGNYFDDNINNDVQKF